MIHQITEQTADSWISPEREMFAFNAIVSRDEDGGFFGSAMNYPGVISEGDSESEVVENLREAFLVMLESRRQHGESMMYSSEPVAEVGSDSRTVRITVHG